MYEFLLLKSLWYQNTGSCECFNVHTAGTGNTPGFPEATGHEVEAYSDSQGRLHVVIDGVELSGPELAVC